MLLTLSELPWSAIDQGRAVDFDFFRFRRIANVVLTTDSNFYFFDRAIFKFSI